MLYLLFILLLTTQVRCFVPSIGKANRKTTREAISSHFRTVPALQQLFLRDGNSRSKRLLQATKQRDTSLDLAENDVNNALELESSREPRKKNKKSPLPTLDEYKAEIEQDTKDRFEKLMRDNLNKQASVKDGEIKKLLNRNQKKETEVNRLKFQLAEAKSAMKTSEKKRDEAFGKIESLKKETDAIKMKEETNAQAVKEQFRAEKDILLSDVQLMKDQLESVERSSSLQVEEARENYNILKSKIDALELEIQEKAAEIKSAKAEALQSQKDAGIQLKKQKQKAERLQAVSTEQLRAEKRDLRYSKWDLESQLSSARYDLIISQKETVTLNNTISELQQKIDDMLREHLQEIIEMDEKMKANEMFYSRSMKASKTRMVRLVTMFQARMKRRETRNKKEMIDLQESLENQIVQVSERLEREKREVLRAKAEELAVSEAKAEADLNQAQMEYDDMILEMNKKVSFAQNLGELNLNRLELRKNKEMKLLQEQAEQEKKEIIRASDAVLQKLKADSNRIQTGLNQMLMESKREKQELKGIIRDRDTAIEEYEMERSSLRQLTKRATKLAAERVVKKIKTRKFLRFNKRTKNERQEK